jgi:hypothetical protein
MARTQASTARFSLGDIDFATILSASLRTAEQGHFRVPRCYSFNLIRQLNTPLSPAHEANVAQVFALISLKRFDFRLVAGSHHLVPVQPKLAAVGHSVAHLDGFLPTVVEGGNKLQHFAEKLRYTRYIYRNPVKRGLCERPEDWEWSCFRYYATGIEGRVEIESEWAAGKRERAAGRLCLPVELSHSGQNKT